jgi:non-specific serine/threonine protein kinase
VTGLCAVADETAVADIMVAVPERAALQAWLLDLPPMRGAEYADADVLAHLWAQTEAALRAELAASQTTLAEFLHSCNAAWHQVGRVHFNLAENRKDPDSPFAFLATYTSRLSAHGKAQHMPLSRALTEFSDGKQQAQLLNLLVPVQRAAEQCAWLMEMVAEGEIYHPLRWTQAHAYAFLQDVPKLEAAGIVVRTPSNWAAGRPARPKVSASIGSQQPSVLGMDALLDFNMGVTLGDDPLTEAEIQALLQGGDGLQLLRGNWVEVDAQKLKRMLQRFTDIQNISTRQGLSFAEAMRLTARASLDAGDGTVDDAADWSAVSAGPWLAQTLQGLRQPEGLAHIDPRPELQATLRPYQEAGVRWLYLLTRWAWAPAWPTTWGLARPCKSCRCSWCSNVKIPVKVSRKASSKTSAKPRVLPQLPQPPPRPPCWWPRLRCWPIGTRRASVLPPASRCSSPIHRPCPQSNCGPLMPPPSRRSIW